MKALLTNNVRMTLCGIPEDNLYRAKERLLKFLRSNAVTDPRVGLCNSLNISILVEVVSGTAYPIKGMVWETNNQAYDRSAYMNARNALATKYRGYQLKQRRKLARKLLNVIDQYLVETNEN